MTKKIVEERLLKAIEIMEKAANQTTDFTTLKILMTGFEKIKEIKNAK